MYCLSALVFSIVQVHCNLVFHAIPKLNIPIGAAFSTCGVDSSNKKLYFFGGEINATTPRTYLNSTYRLNFTTLSWEVIDDHDDKLKNKRIPQASQGYRGTMSYDNTYWWFGVEGNSNHLTNGTVYYFNLTDETWHDATDESTGNGIPFVPRGVVGLCASYDNDRNIFWLIGGTENTVPDAYNYTIIFNYTTFERGDYDNVWQEGLFGEKKINGTGISNRGADELMYGGACGYQNHKLISFGGRDLENGVVKHVILKYDVLRNVWFKPDDEWTNALTDFRGDVWHDLMYVSGGTRRSGPSEFLSSYVYSFNFTSYVVDYIGDRRNIDAAGVAQCVYNNDTMISWGGWDNDQTYFNEFLISGGMFYFRVQTTGKLDAYENNKDFSTE